MDRKPRIGMGIFVIKDNQVLMIRRKHSHGKGTWAPPGGHLEFGESLEECAIRKINEETSIIITDPVFRGITDDLFKETGKHYITIWMEGKYVSGKATIGSAREISDAGWFPWDSLPTPFFLTFKHIMEKRNCYGFGPYSEVINKVSKIYGNSKGEK